MHQFIKQNIKVSSVALAIVLGLSLNAQAAPAEKVRLNLTKTATSGLQITDSLTKNIFRQESVQVPYTIQEPYDVTENYIERIPYQDTETYYESVPYQEQETYTDIEEYTDYEHRCEERSRDERVCQDKQDCHIVPGRGPDGGPRRECTTQPICETVTRRYQECGNVPVQKTRRVTKTRWVTKYREERRTRTITKYRDEQRTRTVTRYRDKQVCCKTEIRTVYDHQFTLPVIVNFPAETVLLGAEQEVFVLQLAGSEAAPSVTLSPLKTIFGYAIDRQEIHGGAMVIDLKRVALYNQDQLGVSSIKGLGLKVTKTGAEINFSDEGLRPRVNTAYSYQVREASLPDVLAQGSLVAQQAAVAIPLQIVLEEGKTYQVDVRVVRQGLPLAVDIDVVVSASQKISLLKDASVYSNKALINTFEVRGEKEEARLFFRDQSPKDEGVSTVYRIEILAGGKTGEVILKKDIRREDMIVTEKGFYRMMLGSDLGVPAQALKDKVRDGKKIAVRVTTTRQHFGLNEGRPVILESVHSSTVHK